MEVRPGFKQTEVGIIPTEWEAGSLGRFWRVTDCKHVTATFVTTGFPVASIKEVQSRLVDLTNAKQTTHHFYNLLTEGGRKPQPGDLILSRNATVGEVAQVSESHPPFAMGQDVCLLRKKDPDHSTTYLQALFQSPILQKQLSNLMVGSTFKRANVQQIRNFSVPMPSPQEQRAIAAALSDVDALLDVLDRLIGKKRDLKQAAMQQLVTGQIRLPGFHGEWKVDRFGSLVESVFPKSALSSGDGLERGSFPLFVSGREHKWTESAQFRDAEALVFSDGGVFGVRRAVGSFSVTDHCFAVTLHHMNADMRWFEAWFQLYSQQMDRLTFKGSGLRNLHKPSLRDIVIKNPDREEQIAIATVLSDMDAELAALEARRDKTRDLKQAMMQELLTGKTRLVAAGAAHA